MLSVRGDPGPWQWYPEYRLDDTWIIIWISKREPDNFFLKSSLEKKKGWWVPSPPSRFPGWCRARSCQRRRLLAATGSRGVTGVLVPATDFHFHGAVGLHDP